MNKKNAMVLLIVFGNLSVIVIGAAQIFLFAAVRFNFVIGGAPALAVLAAHTVAATFSRRRFKRVYGVSARRYILCGTLPATILSVLLFIILGELMRFDIRGVLLPFIIDMIPIDWIMSMFASGYSVLFLAAQFVIVAREIW